MSMSGYDKKRSEVNGQKTELLPSQNDQRIYGNNGGQVLLPPEVCRDLTDIRPLNARGGLSNLFRAHKVGLDVDVVIKRVKKTYRGMMDEKGEARIMTALRHQYLPRIYDLKTADDGYTYTIMELIEGETLRDYVKVRGSLDQKQALKWTRQLCQVLDYMHSHKPKGIIHSDLKPENVMVTPHGDICVIDFNASLEVEEDGDALEAIGATIGYAAPEQYNLPLSRFQVENPLYPLVRAAQGMGKVSYRTDIYSVGAIAYYMLTGYDPKPWTDGNIPLQNYDIELGDAFRQVIQKAMEVAPGQRYKSAESMLNALSALSKIDTRYRKWIHQCRITTLIIGLGLAASVTCIVLGVQNMGQARQEEYLQLVQQAQQQRNDGKYDLCRDTLLEAIGMDDDRIEAYLELGAMLYQQGEYWQSINLLENVEYKKSAAMDEGLFLDMQGQISYVLGSCYYQLEDYRHALEQYQMAVWFCEDEIEYQRELAVCYAKVGENLMAEQALGRLKDMDCHPADLALVEGEIAYAVGQYERAYENLLVAAETAQDTALMGRCYMLAAKSCQQMGTDWIDTQITILEDASVRMGTGNSLILQQLAEAYLAKSTQSGADSAVCYEHALSCLQQLMDRGFAPFAVRRNAAVTLQYLDRFDEAEQVLCEMLAEFPNDYRVSMQLALLCADRESEKAVSDRDYTEFGNHWKQAQQLYRNAAVQDSEMIRLEEIAAQLNGLGWTF